MASDQRVQPSHNSQVRLSWNIHHCFAKLRGGRTVDILHDMQGFADGGQLIGIFGKSGAGKTTFLNVLGRRNRKNLRINGHNSVLLNGRHVPDTMWRYYCAYVEQTDAFFSFLSLEEILHDACALFCHLSRSERDAKVQNLMMQLDLMSVRYQRVSVLSGGQKKRLSIAIQLLLSPRVLLLDEPTSGLDSKTAQHVVQLLRRLATEDNVIVLMTVHMPRYSIVTLLDKLLVVHRGTTTFYGTLEELTTSLTQHGSMLNAENNATDLYLDHIDSLPMFELGSLPENLIATLPALSRRPSKWTQFWTLLKRHIVLIWRDRRLIVNVFVQNVFITVLVSAVFWQLNSSQEAIQSRTGVLFFLLINQTFSYMMPLVTAFPAEKNLLYKEYLSAGFPPFFTYFARYFAQWTVVFLTMTFTVTVLFFTVGLKGFLLYYLALFLVTANAVAVGLTIGAFAPTPQIGQAITPSIAIALILVAGLYANKDSIPKFISWIEYISFVSYGYGILINNEFQGQRFTCTDPLLPCYATGEQVIRYLQLDRYSFLSLFSFLLCLLFATVVLGCLGVTIAFRTRR